MKKLFILLAIGLSSCVSDKEEGVAISDETLFSLATTTSSFRFFNNSADTIPTANASPHQDHMRVRFNPKAVTALDSALSILVSGSFPEESMVVKEIYDGPGQPLRAYAIMYKMPAAANARSGWVWSEIDKSGNVIYSSANNGAVCENCHRAPDNMDFVRTFRIH